MINTCPKKPTSACCGEPNQKDNFIPKKFRTAPLSPSLTKPEIPKPIYFSLSLRCSLSFSFFSLSSSPSFFLLTLNFAAKHSHCRASNVIGSSFSQPGFCYQTQPLLSIASHTRLEVESSENPKFGITTTAKQS